MIKTVVLRHKGSAFTSWGMTPAMHALVKKSVDSLGDTVKHNQPLLMRGKTCVERRGVAFFSAVASVKSFRYAGGVRVAHPMPEAMHHLLAAVNTLMGADFNAILVNKYASGKECIGAHSDDERGLDPTTGVVTVSYGAARQFCVMCKETGALLAKIDTGVHRILQMDGTSQKTTKHGIRAEKKVAGARISFTFRRHIS